MYNTIEIAIEKKSKVRKEAKLEKKQSQKEGPIKDQKYIFSSTNNYFVNSVCVFVSCVCLYVCVCHGSTVSRSWIQSFAGRSQVSRPTAGRVQVSWLIKVWIVCIYVDGTIHGVPKTQNKFLVKNVNFFLDIALAKLDFSLLLLIYIVIAFQLYNIKSCRSLSPCFILCIG